MATTKRRTTCNGRKICIIPISVLCGGGKSLQEEEIRESNLVKMVIIAWILCFVIIVLNWGWGYYRIQSKT